MLLTAAGYMHVSKAKQPGKQRETEEIAFEKFKEKYNIEREIVSNSLKSITEFGRLNIVMRSLLQLYTSVVVQWYE